MISFRIAKTEIFLNRNLSLFNPHSYFAKFITKSEALKYETRYFARMTGRGMPEGGLKAKNRENPVLCRKALGTKLFPGQQERRDLREGTTAQPLRESLQPSESQK